MRATRSHKLAQMSTGKRQSQDVSRKTSVSRRQSVRRCDDLVDAPNEVTLGLPGRYAYAGGSMAHRYLASFCNGQGS